MATQRGKLRVMAGYCNKLLLVVNNKHRAIS